MNVLLYMRVYKIALRTIWLSSLQLYKQWLYFVTSDSWSWSSSIRCLLFGIDKGEFRFIFGSQSVFLYSILFKIISFYINCKFQRFEHYNC